MNGRKILNSFIRRNELYLRFFNRSYTSEVTAGILIIGDEILNGQTKDTNSTFLIENVNNSGLKLNKLAILPDDVDVIANEVASLSQNCTVVLTSGGIGPTHDDVTYEAVAKAFGEGLKCNGELTSLFKDYFGPQADEIPSVMKFSSIPTSAKLNYGIDKRGNKTRFPIVSTKNVFMLPGVPMLLHRGFDVFKSNFSLHNEPNPKRRIFISLDEFTVTPILNSAVKLFHKKVKFGSYPSFSENYYKVKLVLESKKEEWIQEAYDFFKENLPKGYIVDLKDNILLSAKEDLDALCKQHPPLSQAVSIAESALEQYSLSEICICFNGGKDCTALLHLLYACVQKSKSNERHQIQALYVKNGETFSEVEDFIQLCVKKYQLNLTSMKGELKESFASFIKEHPQIKAVFMGTRRSDPGSENLTHFSPTDEDWPRVMRILPILNWSYTDVWTFLRELQVPYCTLYDRGYTSLGLKSQTKPNPALLASSQKGFRLYKPAYTLKEYNEERNGRMND